jgi:hypothetical protein
MISVPYPITSDDWESMRPAITAIIRDLYENRIGGAMIGDVFQIGGDTLELKLSPGSGLIKTNGALDIDVDTIGTNGAVMKVSYTAKGIILVGTAASTVTALTVGSNNDVLTADSGQVSGTKWAHVIAANVTNTPAGGIAATDVQTALNELDTEKQTAGAKIDMANDVIIDLATKGLVLKDTQGTPHYWRVTIDNSGSLVTTDVGTVKP